MKCSYHDGDVDIKVASTQKMGKSHADMVRTKYSFSLTQTGTNQKQTSFISDWWKTKGQRRDHLDRDVRQLTKQHKIDTEHTTDRWCGPKIDIRSFKLPLTKRCHHFKAIGERINTKDAAVLTEMSDK